jgi:hypothetical protein
MKSNLAGLYIQIEAKKRRINIINLWKVPKRGRKYVVHGEGGQRWAETESTSHPNNFVILRPASFAGRRIYGLVGSSGVSWGTRVLFWQCSGLRRGPRCLRITDDW